MGKRRSVPTRDGCLLMVMTSTSGSDCGIFNIEGRCCAKRRLPSYNGHPTSPRTRIHCAYPVEFIANAPAKQHHPLRSMLILWVSLSYSLHFPFYSKTPEQKVAFSSHPDILNVPLCSLVDPSSHLSSPPTIAQPSSSNIHQNHKTYLSYPCLLMRASGAVCGEPLGLSRGPRSRSACCTTGRAFLACIGGAGHTYRGERRHPCTHARSWESCYSPLTREASEHLPRRQLPAADVCLSGTRTRSRVLHRAPRGALRCPGKRGG